MLRNERAGLPQRGVEVDHACGFNPHVKRVRLVIQQRMQRKHKIAMGDGPRTGGLVIAQPLQLVLLYTCGHVKLYVIEYGGGNF